MASIGELVECGKSTFGHDYHERRYHIGRGTEFSMAVHNDKQEQRGRHDKDCEEFADRLYETPDC